MIDWDELLGSQQDDLASQRYDLIKLCEQNEEYKDCKSDFDVFCRMHELHGETEIRLVLEDFLKRINPSFKNIEHWIEILLETIKKKDGNDYKRARELATLAAFM